MHADQLEMLEELIEGALELLENRHSVAFKTYLMRKLDAYQIAKGLYVHPPEDFDIEGVLSYELESRSERAQSCEMIMLGEIFDVLDHHFSKEPENMDRILSELQDMTLQSWGESRDMQSIDMIWSQAAGLYRLTKNIQHTEPH